MALEITFEQLLDSLHVGYSALQIEDDLSFLWRQGHLKLRDEVYHAKNFERWAI